MGIYGIPESFTGPSGEDSSPVASDVPVTPDVPQNRRPTGAVIDERDSLVHQFVQNHPGVSRVEIARALDLSLPQTYLALTRLGTGKVYTKRVDRAYLWFPVIASGA